MQRSEFVRAMVALSVALAFTVIVGALLGYSTNPAASHAQQARITEFYAANPVNTPAENEAFLATLAAAPRPEPPPEAIAVIQWHSTLLAGLMFAGLLAFRPGRVESAIVAALASVAIFLAAGVMPTFAMIGAFGAYLLIASLVPRLRRAAA